MNLLEEEVPGHISCVGQACLRNLGPNSVDN